MLTSKKFNNLNIDQQSDLVRLNATFLFKKFERDHIKFLYVYNGFFIEVSYFENEATVEINAFDFNYFRIEGYLSDVDLLMVS